MERSVHELPLSQPWDGVTYKHPRDYRRPSGSPWISRQNALGDSSVGSAPGQSIRHAPLARRPGVFWLASRQLEVGNF